MFYSHEVLTSPEHGVAIVWLVATLGAKSALKKVKRKGIINVDVPKACETILAPEAPMALRLQSNLLYGVSKVYLQQCGYVLTDAERAQHQMRALLKIVKTPATEPSADHIARPEQITLQADPEFDPDLDLDRLLGPTAMDLGLSTPDLSQRSLSPYSAHTGGFSSQHGLNDTSFQGLIIPPSASSVTAGPLELGYASASVRDDDGRRTIGLGSTFLGDQDRLEDPGFHFDDDTGDLVLEPLEPQAPMAAGAAGATRTVEAAGPQAQAEPGSARPSDTLDADDFLPTHDEYDLYPDAEAFPPQARSAEPTAPDGDVHTDETAASAPARSKRAKRVIPPDHQTELRNRDLAAWTNDYLDNMQEAGRHREQLRAATVAKKNAEFWVLGNGLGGLRAYYGHQSIPEPLRMFVGNSLLESLTGIKLSVAGEKRASDEEAGDDSGADGRRVRPKEDGTELGRGDNDIYMDDAGDLGVTMGDDTIEMGRQGQTPLIDPSPLMPWNSASMRVSSAHAAGAVFPAGGFQTSSVAGGLSRRGSRMPTASPLLGRGKTSPQIQELDDYQLPLDDTGEPAQGPHPTVEEEFETFGLAAGVDTQTAGTVAWMRQALDSECGNFLDFVAAGIQRADQDRDADPEADEDGRGSVTFETLLPPADNTRIVAAQGLLHVLALVTKNVLRVEQAEAFAAISMRLI